MSLEGIIAYVTDAGVFALQVGALFLLGSILWQRGRPHWLKTAQWTLFVSYLAALLKITAIRLASWGDFSLFHSTESLRLIPIWNTLCLLEEGLWFFTYNVVGNLFWFVPLGFCLRCMFRSISWKLCLFLGAGLSFVIELLQWLLQSGISDVDDILLNALGALLGWGLYPVVLKIWNCWRKRV